MSKVDPELALKYLDNLDINKEIDIYFSKIDVENIGVVDADNYKNIFFDFNKKLGLGTPGKNEWDWSLNLIKKKSGDKINKKEAYILFEKMVLIARDYFSCLPNYNKDNKNNNNLFKLIKEMKFEPDIRERKSINTLVDLNEKYFLATIGEKGKIIIDKSNYEIFKFKKDFGFYISNKLNKNILSAINSENEGNICYSDFNLTYLNKFEINEEDKHKSWITKIIPLTDNKIATSSGDKIIKIWEIIENKKLKLIKNLEKHSLGVISIINIKDKDLLISCSYDNKVIIWNLNDYSILHEINNVQCSFINGLKELPNQRIAVSGEKKLVFIDYMKGKILRKLETEFNACCFEIMKEELLIGCFDGNYHEIT